MENITVGTLTFPVFKIFHHLKDIKNNTDNGDLFKRFYSRKHFLSVMKKNYDELYNCSHYDEGYIGGIVGRLGADDYYIEVYKLMDMDKDELQDFVQYGRLTENNPTHFIMENDGCLYAIRTDRD